MTDEEATDASSPTPYPCIFSEECSGMGIKTLSRWLRLFTL
ncbi:hypothetical protein [Methylobacter sp.]